MSSRTVIDRPILGLLNIAILLDFAGRSSVEFWTEISQAVAAKVPGVTTVVSVPSSATAVPEDRASVSHGHQPGA